MAAPTRAEQHAAAGLTIPDVIAPSLRVLFCGINPGLYSAATGYHFARPGNRFWPALHASGFTDRLLHPSEQDRLLELGLGITNVAARSTARADQLSAGELLSGGQILASKLETIRPNWLAVLGVTAYRTAFGHPKAILGRQSITIAGTPVWVLPNPSGLNAHSDLPKLARLFAELREAVGHEQEDTLGLC